MSVTVQELLRTALPISDAPELSHEWCDCSRPVMLCGVVDVSHECPNDLSCGCIPCVVCEELWDRPCEKCGAP